MINFDHFLKRIRFSDKNQSPGSIRHVWQNRQKIKWPYLGLHTTHTLDF